MIDISVLITALAGLITTVGSSVITWLFTRKKYNAEVDSTKIDNLSKQLNFYIQLSDDTQKRLNEVLEQKRKLEEDMTTQRRKFEDEILALKMQMADMYLLINKKAPKKTTSKKAK